MTYVQCRLQKRSLTGVVEKVSWIPKKYAKIENWISLLDNGEWQDGWKVYAIYGECDEEHLPDPHVDCQSIWKATSGDEPRGNK